MAAPERVFVSGGAGVIGEALVRRLHAQGCCLLVGDLVPRPAHWPGDILYRRGDLNFVTRDELEAFAPEVFYHLAATFERSTESADFWDEGARHNVQLSHHLMTCLRDVQSLRRVVFASSYLIYDPALYTSPDVPSAPVTLPEDSPVAPRNLCGSAKYHHELELEFLQEACKRRFSAVSARIFRSYGRGSRDVVSRWIRCLLAGGELETYRTEARFDYVSAEDVAEGLIALARSDATGPVNLGSGRARSVGELLAVLRQHFPDLRTRPVEMAIPFEAAQADTSRCRALTGWAPSRSLEQMVPDLIAYERERRRPEHGDRAGAAPATGAARTATAPATGAARTATAPATGAARTGVMVTSVSRKVPLIRSLRRALARLGTNAAVHGADADPDALAAHFVDAFWQMPPLDALSPEALVAECERRGVGVLIPTRDGELPWLARHRDRLRAGGVEVMVSPLAALEHCLDKRAFAASLRAVGLPAIAAADRPERLPGVERFVVKARRGSGSRGVRCDLSAAETRAAVQAEPDAIVQPFVPGPEYSIDLYVTQQGRLHGAVCRSRDRVEGGESQITTTRSLPELEALCARAALHLGLRGHVVFQAIRGPHGFELLECNPRFGGASPLAVAAGLDSFTWFLLEAAGESLDAHSFFPRRDRLRLVRHAADWIAP